ncbi:MAG: EVE domain-containing protein [Methanophagales archaeon]|nr:EVE domain-containing protein [Methanophagales archaeon]
MQQFWLMVGTEKNWKVAFESNNIWGLKDFRELRSLWNMLREGDGLLFYVSKPVHGIVGFGHVVTKFRQTNPLWPDEIKKDEVIWPLRFEFDIEYCLSPSLWKSHKYTSHDLQMISRMVFQCYPVEEVNTARIALGLKPLIETVRSVPAELKVTTELTTINHDDLKAYLAEIGRIQGYIADEEYPLDSTRLDVVWRRVERSVPTFVFEVQIGGDIYHAMAKLKHASDLWNSHIFLVATMREKSKYQELISGTFHEVADKMRFIDVTLVKELLEKKRGYKEMERALGILKR